MDLLVAMLLQTSPMIPLVPEGTFAYQHIEYLGCGSVLISGASLGFLLKSMYSGLFCKGFTIDQLQSLSISTDDLEDLIAPCIHNGKLLQLATMNDLGFNHLVEGGVLTLKQGLELIEFNRKFLMTDEEIHRLLVELEPELAALVKTWNDGIIKSVNLTSVGLSIGRANYRRLTGANLSMTHWW